MVSTGAGTVSTKDMVYFGKVYFHFSDRKIINSFSKLGIESLITRTSPRPSASSACTTLSIFTGLHHTLPPYMDNGEGRRG